MRRMFWKHRLKYVLAVVTCLGITLLVYLNLPDGTSQSAGNNRVIRSQSSRDRHVISAKTSHKSLSANHVTVVIREFEEFENGLLETVNKIERNLGAVNVLVIADTLPYPPVNLSRFRTAHVITLSSDLSKNYSSSCLFHFLRTEYVLFISDGVKIGGLDLIQRASSFLVSGDVKAVAIPVGDEKLGCSFLNVSVKEWTVSMHGNATGEPMLCSFIQGTHALLMKRQTLESLAEPFARPFPYTFYVQAVIKNWKTRILSEGRFSLFLKLFRDFHSSWKHKQAESRRLREFYEKVGIKQEILKSGISNNFGCTKKTSRCFGSVIKDMPQYLYEGKWTPPCCLQGLRESAAHVFKILEKCKARYWLEGGSLLGAARLGNIIPWDYDVDIGIYQEDLAKCYHLQQAKLGSYIDDEDFVWEKASEGEFYRVQYSETNHLHVDIFPFYSKDGTMTKNTWFATHRQDTEFPESFLIPLTRIKFAGTEARAPNNVRQFLEYKFGKNVIENPRYPDLQAPVH